MGDWLTRSIPVYKVYPAWVGLLLVLFTVASFLQPRFGKKQAQSAATRSEIHGLDLFLDEYLKTNGRLPAGDNAAIVSALAARPGRRHSFRGEPTARARRLTDGKRRSKFKSREPILSSDPPDLTKLPATRTTAFSTAPTKIL